MASKKKRELSVAEINSKIVGNRSVCEWERQFKPVEQGFYGDLSFTSHRVGILIVRYNREIVFIGSGTARGQGMLARLRQLAFTNSTGGRHSAARKIRDNLRGVELDLLLLKREDLPIANILELTRLLKTKYNPHWAVAEAVIKAKIAGNYLKV